MKPRRTCSCRHRTRAKYRRLGSEIRCKMMAPHDRAHLGETRIELFLPHTGCRPRHFVASRSHAYPVVYQREQRSEEEPKCQESDDKLCRCRLLCLHRKSTHRPSRCVPCIVRGKRPRGPQERHPAVLAAWLQASCMKTSATCCWTQHKPLGHYDSSTRRQHTHEHPPRSGYRLGLLVSYTLQRFASREQVHRRMTVAALAGAARRCFAARMVAGGPARAVAITG